MIDIKQPNQFGLFAYIPRMNPGVLRITTHKATDLAKELNQLAFQVEISHSYGQYLLPKAHAALVAIKSRQ